MSPLPERLRILQAWIEDDAKRLWVGAPSEVSLDVKAWWICDKDGLQIARHPLEAWKTRDFGWRSYFTRLDRDLDPNAVRPVPPTKWVFGDGPRLSAPFKTLESELWVVAISAPVYAEPGEDGKREFLGVVGMFVELGALIGDHGDEADGQDRVAILLDPRADGESARIIDHPYYGNPRASVVVPDRGSRLADETAKILMNRDDWESRLGEDPFARAGLEDTRPFAGRWRTASARVQLEERTPAGAKPRSDDAYLIALVREPEGVVTEPSHQLRQNLRWLGVAVAGLFLVPPLVALFLATRRRT